MDGIELVVRAHFDGYKPGDIIADKAKIDEVLAGAHEHDVIKRSTTKAPSPSAPSYGTK